MSIVGLKYGRLTLTSERVYTKTAKGWYAGYVNWICECGKSGTSIYGNIKKGTTKSCGCLNSELTSKRFLKHGLSYHPAMQTYSCIKSRCYNKNNPDN